MRASARAAFDRINISLASLQSSLLLLAEIERSNPRRPIALPLPEGPLPETPASRRDGKTETRSQPVWWDTYRAAPKAVKLGEVKAADKREANEKAAKRLAVIREVRVTTPDGRKATVRVEYNDGSTQVIVADQLSMPSPIDPATAKIQVANQLKKLTVAPQGIEPDQIIVEWAPAKA